MSSGRGGLTVALLSTVALLAAGTSAADPSRSELAAATLDLRATLRLLSDLGGCPTPPSADECALRTTSGDFSGLGRVAGRYQFLVKNVPPPCAVGFGMALATSIRLVVASKGEILADVAETPCVDNLGTPPLFNQPQTFTITGGTGIYAGASGSGTLERRLGEQTASGRVGQEIWAGSLSVPGLEFDLIKPTFMGAVNKTVRPKKGAKTARVVFRVTAQDDRDSTVPVTCTPRSGTPFKAGRTRVTCSATDSSANTSTASFTVTVRATR